MKTSLALAIFTATLVTPLGATAGDCGGRDGYMKHGYMKHGYMPRPGYSRQGYAGPAYRDYGRRGYAQQMPMRGYHSGGGQQGAYGGNAYGNSGYGNNGYGSSAYGGKDYGSGADGKMSNEQQSAPAAPAADTKPGTDDASSGPDVNISGMRFQPAVLTVDAGEVVTWTNNSAGMPHTVTGDGNQLASSRMNQGSTFEFKFDEPGTYNYYCALHPSMTGTIVVQ